MRTRSHQTACDSETHGANAQVMERNRARSQNLLLLDPCAILAKNMLFYSRSLASISLMQETVLLTKPPAQKHSSKRQTVQVVSWVKPAVRAEVKRLAEQEGL